MDLDVCRWVLFSALIMWMRPHICDLPITMSHDARQDFFFDVLRPHTVDAPMVISHAI